DERAGTWSVKKDGTGLTKLTDEQARDIVTPITGRWDRAHKRALAAEGGDIVIIDGTTGARKVLMRTAAAESNPRWARNETAITFVRENNLYLVSLTGGTDVPALVQLTDVVAAGGPAGAGGAGAAAGGRGGRAGGAAGAAGGAQGELTEAQKLMRDENAKLIEFVRNQQAARGGGAGGAGRGGRGGAAGGGAAVAPVARLTLTDRQTVADLALSSDENYVYIGVNERPELAARGQDTPNYVTASSFPEMIPGRTNVGDTQAVRTLAILNLKENKSVWADSSTFGGKELNSQAARIVNWSTPEVSPDGANTVVAASSQDNKDRWYLRLDPATGKAQVLDNYHDEAWIREASVSASGGAGGFGGGGFTWLNDSKRILFMSEKDGALHIYSLDVSAAQPKAVALTSGAWEVTSAQLSNDRTKLFITTNEVHPGERHFYTMSVDGGARTKVTTMTGSNEVTVSPDEKSLALVYSYSTKPPEVFVMPFTAAATAVQVTTTPAAEWSSFKWIDPKVITYKARDGKDVYARLFTPEMIGAKRDPKKPAVIFVHGAGYLQNAHKYWSTYFREYMFHNMLASKGYVVLDPDYRASSGYGRDWRTGIYRHMGGKDLEDVVDGANFLVKTEKVDAKRIGVYGGSYGGFITLMAMFTTPDVFAAGAALRPVTDWSHYNHGYTSNILNVPTNDMEAYRKSSPIYFAEGLKGQLLILHGMVDTNVFFQDSVRLIQRLIELRKETWAIAPYPVENHGFTEETSWADEYKRIFKLFEENLRLKK
ncbi:MAG: prolyl oligopeptidase family serine peptidase, partial [Acidobacteria bacterium]|nr:prolyl oligopeptidase family serine peptidase [Acidobacteriota bacterium]